MKTFASMGPIAALVIVAAASGCANQSPCSGSACTGDEKTTASVNAAIAAHAELGAPSDIQVQTVNHVVYLTGNVDSVYQRSTAENIAAHTRGVSQVIDTIDISN